MTPRFCHRIPSGNVLAWKIPASDLFLSRLVTIVSENFPGDPWDVEDVNRKDAREDCYPGEIYRHVQSGIGKAFEIKQQWLRALA